jgi:DNA helicase-2/ATP-dependent DNA helicase PcrA
LARKYVLKSIDPPPSPAPSTIDYEEELNEAQREAAMFLEGPLLVVAGAGTGKTRTLVYRVARLIERGIDPRSVLLLTFTRRAAEEMLQRASLLTDSRCERIAGGTFHSFGNMVLRQYGQLMGLAPGFTIMDRSDSEDVIQLLRTEMGLDKREKRFPRKQTIGEIQSLARNRQMPLAELVEREYSHLADFLEELTTIAERYRIYKREKSLLDYDDLLTCLKDLLDAHEDLRRRLSERFRFIMVDEYQDTNRLQSDIIRRLAFAHENVMAVGDDAQSIYSFRGAHFRNIMDFPNQFPGTRIIPLEENYRSTQPILRLTNEIIGRAAERYEKNLYSRKSEGEMPLLVQAESEHTQSRFVCQRVLELREEGVPLWDMAVLFRSSFHSFDLEIELARHDIPFVKRGGFQFMETAHIKDVLAHLRVVSNPRDAVSWGRVLMLLEGVGAQTSRKLIEQLLGQNDPSQWLRDFESSGRAKQPLRTLGQVLGECSERTRPADMAQYLMQYYLPILKRKHADDYPKRLRDLEHFQGLTERYQSIERLLSDMALDPPSASVDEAQPVDPDEGPLVLSTVHSAKGLEWHSVFIIWALEGRFPSYYNTNSIEELEEERRLLYVAATRAKENLFFSYPSRVYDRSLGMVFSRPSQFIDGISDDLLEPMSLVHEDWYYSQL